MTIKFSETRAGKERSKPTESELVWADDCEREIDSYLRANGSLEVPVRLFLKHNPQGDSTRSTFWTLFRKPIPQKNAARWGMVLCVLQVRYRLEWDLYQVGRDRDYPEYLYFKPKIQNFTESEW